MVPSYHIETAESNCKTGFDDFLVNSLGSQCPVRYMAIFIFPYYSGNLSYTPRRKKNQHSNLTLKRTVSSTSTLSESLMVSNL